MPDDHTAAADPLHDPFVRRLPLPVPPDLEGLIGYPAGGDAAWVSVAWEPCGDEPWYDDGSRAGTGNADAYLAFVRHPRVAPLLVPYALGASDAPARHRLLIHRPALTLFVAPDRVARHHLRGQWPPAHEVSAGVAAGDLADPTALSGADILAGWSEVPIAPVASVRALLDARRERVAAMVAWLDDWFLARGRSGGS